jgi:uncharacterized protein (DUF433 family)
MKLDLRSTPEQVDPDMDTVGSDYRIVGTRITIWDILHYLENGWEHQEIARVLGISPAAVQGAVDFIAQHSTEVMAVHRQIEDRNARGNASEVEAARAASRAKVNAFLSNRNQEFHGAGNTGGR